MIRQRRTSAGDHTIFVVILAASLCGAAQAQRPPRPPPAPIAPTSPPAGGAAASGSGATGTAAPAAGGASASAPAAPDALSRSGGPFKLPLVREGSQLLRAPATLRRDQAQGTWIVTLRDDLDTERDREVVALPCEALADMIAQVRGKREIQWFEISGMMVVYKQRNYLLLYIATPLSAEPPRAPRVSPIPPGGRAAAGAPVAAAKPAALPPSSAPAPVAGASAPSEPPPTPPPAKPIDPETFAASVEKDLEARIGVVPRSSDAAPPASPFSSQQPGRALSSSAEAMLLPSVVRLHDRRGVVTRDPLTGAWRFVFQSDRAEIGERDVEILPGHILERLEKFVRESENSPAILVSGQLTSFEGRNYLLPSSFRTIAAGRWVYP